MLSKMLIVMSVVAVALTAPTGSDSNTQMPAPLKKALTNGLDMLESMMNEAISNDVKLNNTSPYYELFDRAMAGVYSLSSRFCYVDRPANKIQDFADSLKQKVDQLGLDEYSFMRAQPENFERTNENCKEIENDVHRSNDMKQYDLADGLDALLSEFDSIVSDLSLKTSMFECPPEYQMTEDQARRMFNWAQKYADLVDDYVTEVDEDGVAFYSADTSVDKLNRIQKKVGEIENTLKNHKPSITDQATQLRNKVKDARDHTENIASRNNTY